MCVVVNAVRKALEVVAAAGQARAVNYARVPGGEFGALACMDLEAAQAVLGQLIQLAPGRNLAMMWRVQQDDPRLGWAVCQDLASFAYHELGDKAKRFGYEAVLYWVRHWAKRDGSSREAAALFGGAHDTHWRWYREAICPVLDGWFIAAKGVLEPVIEGVYLPEAVCVG